MFISFIFLFLFNSNLLFVILLVFWIQYMCVNMPSLFSLNYYLYTVWICGLNRPKSKEDWFKLKRKLQTTNKKCEWREKSSFSMGKCEEKNLKWKQKMLFLFILRRHFIASSLVWKSGYKTVETIIKLKTTTQNRCVFLVSFFLAYNNF